MLNNLYHVRNSQYIYSDVEGVFCEYALTEEDVQALKFLALLFENQRLIFFRDSRGNLFARKTPTSKGVQLNRDLLGFIPRGKYIDLRSHLKCSGDTT